MKRRQTNNTCFLSLLELTHYGNIVVSFCAIVVKYILIYRHLQYIYKFKRGASPVTRSTQ